MTMIKQMKNEKINQKLTPEELTEFREIYETYQKAVFELGTLSIDIDNIVKQLDTLTSEKTNLLNHINVLIEKQTAIGNKLGDKYGYKQVDLETGEFN